MDGKGEGIDGAHRHPGEDETVEPERVDKAFDVLALRCNGVVGVGRPVGIAMPPLIERNAVKLVAQCETAEIPGMRGQCAAMQEEERPQLLISPIEVAEPKALGAILAARLFGLAVRLRLAVLGGWPGQQDLLGKAIVDLRHL